MSQQAGAAFCARAVKNPLGVECDACEKGSGSRSIQWFRRYRSPVHFVYLRVPVNGEFLDREGALHAALEDALVAASVGSLVGWGTSVEPLPSGGRRVAHRVDVEVHDVARACEVLREALLAFAAPGGTELHYTLQGEALQEDLDAPGWGAPRPSTGHQRSRR